MYAGQVPWRNHEGTTLKARGHELIERQKRMRLDGEVSIWVRHEVPLLGYAPKLVSKLPLFRPGANVLNHCI